jgi:hypothetical protein
MKSTSNTFGSSLFNRFITVVICLAGLVTIGSLVCMLPHAGKPTFNVFQTFLVALAILCFTIGYLMRRRRRAKALVAAVNLKEGLSLDDTRLLGYPGQTFFVFDHASQKLAQCQSATGDYHIRDFTWVTGWQCEWLQIERRVSGGVARILNATGMGVPAFEPTRQFIDYVLVLAVADASQPVLRFPMNRTTAQAWCTRCEVLFND